MSRPPLASPRHLHFFLALACLATVATLPAQQTPPANSLSLADRQADFREFIDLFTNNYAYLDTPAKPWLTWQDRYQSAVAAADTPEAYAAVFEDALDELRDFHAEVRSHNPHRWLPVPTFADIWAEFQSGRAIVIAVRPGSDADRAGILPGDRITDISPDSLETAITQRLGTSPVPPDDQARNWALLSLLAGRADQQRHFAIASPSGSSRQVTLQLQRQFDRPPGPLHSEILPGNLGLIRLNNSLGDQPTVAAFDAALLQLKSTRGLLLDLRDVPSGGDSSVALGIMGRFVSHMLPYQRHRIPNYGQPDVERNWIEQVAPRGPFQYRAPVVVLVDHWTGSMGEGIAIGFDAMHRATVVGTPMAHLAGAVSDFTLTRTGIRLAFATEQLFHVNGTPRHAWFPPVLVSAPATPTKDPVFHTGRTLLLAKTSRLSPPAPGKH